MTIIIILINTAIIGCIEENKEEEKTKNVLNLVYGTYNVNFTINELESLESYENNGRFIKNKLLPDSIIIEESRLYTGVKISTLLKNIPDLPLNYSISVISSDGWTINYSLKEINGFIDIYDESGNIQVNGTAVMIIAYMEDGKYYYEFDLNNEIGPLRVAFVGDNIVSPSNLWAKMVERIEIIEI
jgi:hypothetical protein